MGPSNEDMDAERSQFLKDLLESPSLLKVVVAGPGTGKTYSFKELLKLRGEPKLVLTFINNLVSDLARDIGDLADVRTFHGFCRGLLHRHGPGGVTNDVDYYPPLTRIQADDAKALLRSEIVDRDVEAVFHTLDDTSDVLAAAVQAGDYYNAVSHIDSVYRMLLHFRHTPGDIPVYSQIVVDEYQDFSPLEVEFIDQLATVSPTLIVGDDDQALYGFKHASPEFLRRLATGGVYERFELPYCSRCTAVLVDAVNRVVQVAHENGLLAGRIEKRFDSFVPAKGPDSERYPRIIHAQCTVQNARAPYMARYIEKQIRAIPEGEIVESENGNYPTVLVVGPAQFASQMYNYLADRFPNIEYKRSTPLEVRLLDGYVRLLEDPASRLGWRIVCQVDRPDGLPGLIRTSIGVNAGRNL